MASYLIFYICPSFKINEIFVRAGSHTSVDIFHFKTETDAKNLYKIPNPTPLETPHIEFEPFNSKHVRGNTFKIRLVRLQITKDFDELR